MPTDIRIVSFFSNLDIGYSLFDIGYCFRFVLFQVKVQQKSE